MAAKAKTTPAKPARKTPSFQGRTTRPKVAPPRPPELVLQDIETLYVQAEARLKLPREHAINMSYLGDPDMRWMQERHGELMGELDRHFNPKGHYTDTQNRDAMVQACGTPAGQEVGLARPGQCLLWLGYVPVRIQWGGIMNAQLSLHAVDPNVAFLSPSGFVSTYASLEPESRTIVEHVRGKLAEQVARPKFELPLLTQQARERTREYLAEPGNAWIVAALRAGPVDPIALPAALANTQPSLFAIR